MRMWTFVGAALAAAGAPALAQHQHHSAPVASELRVGSVRLANNGNPAAQAPFLRGLALLHNFEYTAAKAAFQQAQAADPGFVLAYWGEAMTYNHPLWAYQDTTAAREALAKLGPTPEARAAKARSAREKQWLDAVEALYGSGSKVERDHAYAEQMRLLHEADPSDVDARTLRALSIMGLAHKGRDVALYMKAAGLLEEALPAHPDHPGLLHYLIHAYDDPVHAPLGERAARRYASVAPDAGHAQHMVSHIYLALGRWPEVEQANVNATRVVNMSRAARGAPLAHCGHYIDWHVYSLLQQGRDAASFIEACRAEALAELGEGKDKTVLGDVRSSVISWSDMAVRAGIETGAWPQTLELPAGRYEFARFYLAYADLLAGRREHSRATAAALRMKRSRDVIAAAMVKEMPDDQEFLPWFDRAVAQSAAIVALAKGERARGLKLLKSAAAAEAALPVPFGPPLLQKPSAELLAEELLKAGRKAEAADAFRQVLAAAPNRRLAVAGLAAAAR